MPDADPEQAIIALYRTCVKHFGWSIQAIDDSNFETLIDFLCYKDPDTMIINGKTYKRVNTPPAWM